MQILGLLGMYFDAVVVFTFFQIGSGHTVPPFPFPPGYIFLNWVKTIH